MLSWSRNHAEIAGWIVCVTSPYLSCIAPAVTGVSVGGGVDVDDGVAVSVGSSVGVIVGITIGV